MFFDTIFAIFRAFVAHKMQLQYYNDFPKYATLIQKFFKKFSTKNRILFIFRHIIFQNTQKVVRNKKPTSFIKYNKAKHHNYIHRFSHYIGFPILFMRHCCSIGQ